MCCHMVYIYHHVKPQDLRQCLQRHEWGQPVCVYKIKQHDEQKQSGSDEIDDQHDIWLEIDNNNECSNGRQKHGKRCHVNEVMLFNVKLNQHDHGEKHG